MVSPAIIALALPLLGTAQPAKEATPVPKPVLAPIVRSATTVTPSQAPTVTSKPAEKTPSVLFQTPKPVASTAPTFSPGVSKPVLKNGATPTPSSSASPVAKPSIGGVGKTQTQLEAEKKASEAKRKVNSDKVATRKARLAKLTAAGVGGAVVGSQQEIATARTELNQAEAELSAIQTENASLQQPLNQANSRALAAQQQPAQPSFLSQVMGGVTLLILFSAGLTAGALWLAGYHPVQSVRSKQLIKRGADTED